MHELDCSSKITALNMSSKALFLDRDGTLIVDHGYLSDPSNVELITGVREALCGFLARDYRLFLFTNQSGVGRGMFGLDAVHRCNSRMFELLDLPPPGFLETCIVPEAPSQASLYRKPSPRFILDMITKHSLNPTESWMIGDKFSDVQAGLSAGVKAAWLGQNAHAKVPEGVWVCRDFQEFAARLFC